MTTSDKRKPVLVNLGKQSLLVKMTSPGQFNGILRRADRKNVDSVRDLLHSNFIDVYLGGGVIRNLFEAKAGKYKDIDLLALYDEIGDFDKVGRYLGSHDNEEVEIGGRKFISHRDSNGAYLNFNGVERFILEPLPNLSSLFGLSSSLIDISFKYTGRH